MANIMLEPVVDSIHKLARNWTNREANDADLLKRFVSGRDEKAFVGLLERHARLVWNVCRRVHGNVHDVAGGSSAATLTNGVLKAMAWQKVKALGAIILATTLLGTSTTVVSYRAFAAAPPTSQLQTKPIPNSPKPVMAEKKRLPVDLYGDPLPEGASARLGSMRWRHNHSSTAFFSPNGKAVATWATNEGTIRLWNATDGKLLRKIARGDGGIWNPIFSPDGQWLAGPAQGMVHAAGDVMNRTLNLMEVATGARRR
jgi:hypothetical protein